VKRTIFERFCEFNTANPWVYYKLVELAKDLKARGYKHGAIGMLWEVLRWQHMTQTPHDPSSEFKLNDHYRSHYARLLMQHVPELKDFFETRQLRSQ
jgi:hypothetical protein